MSKPDDTSLAKRFGINVHAMRKARKMTLQDLAGRSGLAKSYVWEVEKGERTNPSLGTIVSLCEALGCSMDALLGTKPYMEPRLRPEAMRIAVEVDSLLRDALSKR